MEKWFEQKTIVNKAFLIRKLVNLKFKNENPIVYHMNEFQSVVNQLGTMSITLDDEIQSLLPLSSLLDLWETLVVAISNVTTDGKVTMNQVTSVLFNG